MDEVGAERRSLELAIQIPLGSTHAFAALHFAYALGIVMLGLSCLVWPNAGSWGWRRSNGSLRGFSVQDLRSAQVRVSDTSLLVHELSSRPRTGSLEELRRRKLSAYDDGCTGLIEGASESSQRKSVDGDLRVSLERPDNGGLGIDFRKHI